MDDNFFNYFSRSWWKDDMSDRMGKQWLLLAAASKGWKNYRHQADVCHAYQIARRNGIPDKQIVVMMYDDIAYNEKNPFPGNIINVPDGPNVYPGVPRDYTGAEVSADKFLAVLRGDSAAAKKKVIKSGKDDTIFVYLTDHGGNGIFMFPHSTLYAHDLIDTVNTMSRNSRFSKWHVTDHRLYHRPADVQSFVTVRDEAVAMVIYMEACHSGSMLEQLSERNVYAVAACKSEESSYACFRDVERNAYLSNVFTAYWLQHLETDMLGLMLSEFLGQSRRSYTPRPLDFSLSNVADATDVPLIIQQYRIENKLKSEEQKRVLKKQYDDLIRKRKRVDEALQEIARHANAPHVLTEKREVTRTNELKEVAEHFKKNLFNWEEEQYVVTRPHLQILVNLCESGLEMKIITEAITHVSLQFKKP